MTISSTTRKAGPFTGNGATVAFPFTFKVFEAADIVVLLTDAVGAEITQTLTTHYTVSLNADQDTSPGGTVNMVTAPASGRLLTITSDILQLQAVALTNMGGFYPAVINGALDRLTILTQQLAVDYYRTLKLPVHTTSDPLLNKTAAQRADSLVGFDSLGNLYTVALSAIPVSVSASSFTVDTFSGTGAQTAFTLSRDPGIENNTNVFVGGVYQRKGQYSISGTVLTFSAAPASGTNNIEVTQSVALIAGTPADGTVTVNSMSSSALATLDASLAYTPAGTGAVASTVQKKLRESVSVKDFGAVGDNTADDTVAIQAALDSGAISVFFPAGIYKVTTTLTPAANQTLYGTSYNFGVNSKIALAGNPNVPCVKCIYAGVIKDLSIEGSATSTTTNQPLVFINNTNGVTLDSLFLKGGRTLVYIDGTSFYTTIKNCVFYDATVAQLYVNSVSAAGVDLIMEGNRFLSLPATAVYSMYLKGIGSIVASNCVFTVNQGTSGCFYMDEPASSFGGGQFTNCVFENGGTTTGEAIYIKGTSTARWRWLSFVNCNINGGSGSAVRTDYVDGAAFTNCLFSSTNANGSFYIPNSGDSQGTRLTDCSFEGDAGISPIKCGTPVTISMSCISCRWMGSAAFINFSAAASGNVVSLDVIGGILGTATAPVLLTTPAIIPGMRATNAAWTAYTPVVTPVTGALTTHTASGAFQRIGNTINYQITVVITTNGTAATGLDITLPSTATSFTVATGKAIAVSSKLLYGNSNSGGTYIRVANYDATYPGSNGETLVLSGSYQA